jgi:hypothetical protein
MQNRDGQMTDTLTINVKWLLQKNKNIDFSFLNLFGRN